MQDSSFIAFVTAEGGSLLRFALLVCGNRQDAEDVLQDTLVRVAAHWSSIQRTGAAGRYVRRALTHRAIDLRRRRWRENLFWNVPDTKQSSDRYVVDEADARLVRALLTLPIGTRAAIVLRYYCDMADVDVAAALGCRPGTVRSRVSRGLQRLQAELGPNYDSLEVARDATG